MDSQRTCFKCQTAYPPEVVICIKCGINLHTGMLIQTVHKGHDEADGAPAPDAVEAAAIDDPPPTSRERVLNFIAGWLPGLLRPGVMIGSILLCLVGFGLVVLCFVVLTLGAALSAFPIGAVGVIAYGQALAWMMAGDFRLLHDALIDFESRHWSLFFAALFLPFIAGLVAMKILGNNAG